MNKRETKITTLVALIIGVVALTVGFAAFSRNLTIASSARYTTSETDLDVVFSVASDRVMTGDVNATTTGGATGERFYILPNSQTSISDISVSFTAKGQKVEYSFYIYNNSNYTAYGKPLTMEKALESSGTFAPIYCEAATGTNQTLVANACKDIKYTLTATANNTSTVLISVTGAAPNPSSVNVTYNNISIPAKTAIPVKLTIEYVTGSENVVPDGNFDVYIGKARLKFSTQQQD